MKYVFLTAALLFLSTCKKEKEIPVQETGKVYVANGGSGTVSVISVPGLRVVKTVDINSASYMLMPHNIQTAPDGKTIWITAVPMVDSDSEQVVVMDAAKDEIIRRIMLAPRSHLAHVVVDSSSEFAYVTATQIDAVYQLDAKNFQVIKKYPLPTGYAPHGARWFHDKLYVANTGAQRISVIDTRSGAIEEIETDAPVIQTAVAPGKPYVFASQYLTKSVIRYDTMTHSLLTISLPSEAQGPIQLYPTPDGKELYVCDQGLLNGRPASNKVFVIDVEEGKVRGNITVGNAAHGVVTSNDGRHAFIANSGDNSVSVIELQIQKVTATIAVGSLPNGISFWYKGGGMP
jgi:YVTN family beta-propeller protein